MRRARARRRRPERGRPTVGLVLGAGGVVGQAYQVGVLAALEREAHWDARDADLIVGTSAGSVTGAAIRVGVPATDLAASTYGGPMSRQGGALLKRIIPDDSPLPVPSVISLLRPWNPPSLALISRTVRRPLAFRPDVAAMTLLPRGRIDISERARALHEHGRRQLARGPVDLRGAAADGARVVFGRDGSPRAPLAVGRPGLVRHPRLLHPDHHRRHRVLRRRRALEHQRRRAQDAAPRHGDRRLLHVGLHGRCRRRGRPPALVRAPAPRARDRPSRGRRAPRWSDSSRAPSHDRPWGCGPWPSTGRPRWSRRPTKRPGAGSSPARSSPVSASRTRPPPPAERRRTG